MTTLKPGWVDGIAAAVRSGDEVTRSEALGYKPRKRLRIDVWKLQASAARGGRIGGSRRKQRKAEL